MTGCNIFIPIFQFDMSIWKEINFNGEKNLTTKFYSALSNTDESQMKVSKL